MIGDRYLYYPGIVLLLILLLCAPVFSDNTGVSVKGKTGFSVALQPFGKIDGIIVRQVSAGLTKFFAGITIDIRPTVALPKSAWYKPGKRYRAKKLILYLENYYQYNDITQYTRIMGLTTHDISVTRGRDYDRGVAGYALLGTGPAVVSTSRISRRGRDHNRFMKQLVKTVIHELGHTFGLKHCSSAGCVMQEIKHNKRLFVTGDTRFCHRCRPTLTQNLEDLEENND